MLIEKFEFIQREFKSVKQADLPKNHPFRKYFSPTLLLNEQVVFGSPIEGEEGCSVVIFLMKELEERLRGWIRSLLLVCVDRSLVIFGKRREIGV